MKTTEINYHSVQRQEDGCTENIVELINCDDCGAVKPAGAFRSPGHTAGGQINGYDIDSNVCGDCAQRSYDDLLAELAQGAMAEMAHDEEAGVVSCRE
jgi:hypothetical protein